MPKPRSVDLNDIGELVLRLASASKSSKVPRALRADVELAAEVLGTLMVTGGRLRGTIKLYWGKDIPTKESES
jgi:hypothetical protein